MSGPCGKLLPLLLVLTAAPPAVSAASCEADAVCAAAAAASAEAQADAAPEGLHMLQRRAWQRQDSQAAEAADAAAGARAAQRGLYINCSHVHNMKADLVKIAAVDAGEPKFMANMKIQDPMLLSPADYAEPPKQADDSVKLRVFRFINYRPSDEYPNNRITGVNTGDFGWVCTMAAEAALRSDAPETLDKVEYGAYLYIFRVEVLKKAFSHGIYMQCNGGVCSNGGLLPSKPHPGWVQDSDHLGDTEDIAAAGVRPGHRLSMSSCPYYPCMEPPPTLSVRYAEGGPAVLADLRLQQSSVAGGSSLRADPAPGGAAHGAGVRKHARLVEVVPWPAEAVGKEGQELADALTTAIGTTGGGALTLRFLALEHDPYVAREWGTACYGCFMGMTPNSMHSSHAGCFRRDPGVVADRALFPGAAWKGRWYSSPASAEGATLDAGAAGAYFDGKVPALEGRCGAWPGRAAGQWGRQCLERIVPTRCIFLHVLNSTAATAQLAEGDLYEAFRRAVLPTASEAPLPGCEPLDEPDFVTCRS